MVLAHLLYISEAVKPLTREQLEALCEASAANNAEKGITGVLFYSASHFVQLLEGDAETIHALFEKIAVDPRHQRVRLLVLRPAEKRVFSDWNMGLLDLDDRSDRERRDLEELVRLAKQGDDHQFAAPVEMEILSRFCMLLPAA